MESNIEINYYGKMDQLRDRMIQSVKINSNIIVNYYFTFKSCRTRPCSDRYSYPAVQKLMAAHHLQSSHHEYCKSRR